MNETKSRNSMLIFCIENKDFKKYLNSASGETDEQIKFLEIENIPRAIAENPDATLVLQ